MRRGTFQMKAGMHVIASLIANATTSQRNLGSAHVGWIFHRCVSLKSKAIKVSSVVAAPNANARLIQMTQQGAGVESL